MFSEINSVVNMEAINYIMSNKLRRYKWFNDFESFIIVAKDNL